MADAVTLISEAMQADLARLRSIGNNLANINTGGYKREVTSSQALFQLESAAALSNPAPADLVQPPHLNATRDASQGTLKPTDNKMNVAIQGEGYFVVDAGDRFLYTRKGEFKIDLAGRLALLSGERVQGQNGDIILRGENFEIARSGIILQNGETVDRLSIVNLSQDGNTDYTGNGFFAASQPLQPAETETFAVLQGYTEASNVSMLNEMVQMMDITRHFEASGNLLKAYDDILDTSINIIGEF